jgi:hypothetical protein
VQAYFQDIGMAVPTLPEMDNYIGLGQKLRLKVRSKSPGVLPTEKKYRAVIL